MGSTSTSGILPNFILQQESGMDSSSQEEELTQLRAALETEENKRARWRIENIRRKHNYLPLIVNMMKILAEEGKLLPIYHTAREKAKARHEKAKEKNKEKSGVWQVADEAAEEDHEIP